MRIQRMKSALLSFLFLAAPLLVAACGTPEDTTLEGEAGMEGEMTPGMEGEMTPGIQAQPTAELSDEEIETLAEVFVALSDIQTETQARAEGAATQEEQTQLEAEMNQQMMAVLQEHDMTLEQYQQMVQVLNTDPEAQDRFERALEEIQG